MRVLLVLHVAGGSLALLAALVAVLVQARGRSHRAHVVAGRLYVVGMIVVVATALPLSVLIDSTFLALVGVFSGYLMVTGWRFAKNRRGTVGPVDVAIPAVMAVAALAMLLYGAVTWADRGVVLVVFGLVGLFLVVLHARLLRRGPIRGRERIGSHLVWMLAASIATLTAFLVVNGPFGLLDWFLPTILVVPVIVVWRRRLEARGRTTIGQALDG